MLARVKNFAALVKFSHSVFALPFALTMVVICNRITPVSAAQMFWILSAMVSARTAAMGFNRLIDRHVDANNPRTATREIPAGIVSVTQAVFLIVGSSLIFLVSAASLSVGCLYLAPFVLGWLFFYSYCKRFTSSAHLVLGVSLAMAPGGVWYALQGTFAWAPVPLMIAVVLWVAGFDIIYACQDQQFDRAAGLHSIPVRWGVERGLYLSRMLHLASAVFFASFAFAFRLDLVFWICFAVFLALIASQHRLVSATDLSRADAAFFTRNGIASVVFLLGVLLS